MPNEQKIDISGRAFDWMKGSAGELVSALGKDACRFVGGAVRDSLIKKPVEDVDLATTLTPEEVIKRLEAAKIKVVPTGLKFGTVTAVFPGRHFEVTTLRHDVETFGRHAKVAFHDDWREDAARRDFTINALYLSPDGALYDYFGGGDDLKRGQVRFIGDAAKRIEEDALRILRLFRFHAWYGQGPLDRDALEAVGQKLDLLNILSGERVAAETFKLLRAPDPVPLLKAMEKVGVLGQLFEGFTFDFGRLERIVSLENALGDVSGLRRLGAFLAAGNFEAISIATALKLSNRQGKRLLEAVTNPLPGKVSEKKARAELYLHREEAFRDRLILRGGAVEDITALLDYAGGYEIPKFPVQGADLKKRGVKPGTGMGKILDGLEARWLKSDFSLSKSELLKLLKL
ncbi:MAG: CCA tRNA nucleotidyltransferase [Proteobacteria bacterium]|nr:CCA tRNA nucleotidyltransferase [Pseudomonadota bacterium]